MNRTGKLAFVLATAFTMLLSVGAPAQAHHTRPEIREEQAIRFPAAKTTLASNVLVAPRLDAAVMGSVRKGEAVRVYCQALDARGRLFFYVQYKVDALNGLYKAGYVRMRVLGRTTGFNNVRTENCLPPQRDPGPSVMRLEYRQLPQAQLVWKAWLSSPEIQYNRAATFKAVVSSPAVMCSELKGYRDVAVNTKTVTGIPAGEILYTLCRANAWNWQRVATEAYGRGGCFRFVVYASIPRSYYNDHDAFCSHSNWHFR